MWHVFEHDNDLGVSNVFGVRRGLKVNGFEHHLFGDEKCIWCWTWVESEQWI